ncbi:MAG: sialidase family protein, partial [Bacteroidota bacterium]
MKRRLSILLLPLLVHLLTTTLQAQPNPSGAERSDNAAPLPAVAPHVRSRPAGSSPVWTPLNGPAGGNVGALARDSAGNLYAAFVAGPARDRSSMGRGLYRSTDNGATWTYSAFRGDVVRAILVEPSGTIRAVINNMSVVVSPDSIGTSTDNGATWGIQPIDFLYDISQIVARDGHIYAVRSGGYSSIDFLKGWKSFAAPGTMIRQFAVGRNGSIAGTQFNSGDHILVSHDFGATWEEGKPRDIEWIDAGSDGTLYALGEHGMLLSHDGAETWKSLGKPPAGFVEFSADPHAGLLGFGDNGSLYRSIDSGRTWSASRVADVAVSSGIMAADGSIIVGTNGRGLFRGDGTAWSAVGPGIINSEIWSLGISASGALIAGGQAAIYRSTDRGGTWKISAAAIPVDTLFGIRIDPAINGLLVDRGNEMLAACDAWILRSSDGGASWSQFPGGSKFSNMGELLRSDRGTPFTWNEA